jgi:hypothetical protein
LGWRELPTVRLSIFGQFINILEAEKQYSSFSAPGTPEQRYERNTWPVLSRLAKNAPEAGIHFQGRFPKIPMSCQSPLDADLFYKKDAILYTRQKEVDTHNADGPQKNLHSVSPWFADLLSNVGGLISLHLPFDSYAARSLHMLTTIVQTYYRYYLASAWNQLRNNLQLSLYQSSNLPSLSSQPMPLAQCNCSTRQCQSHRRCCTNAPQWSAGRSSCQLHRLTSLAPWRRAR